MHADCRTRPTVLAARAVHTRRGCGTHSRYLLVHHLLLAVVLLLLQGQLMALLRCQLLQKCLLLLQLRELRHGCRCVRASSSPVPRALPTVACQTFSSSAQRVQVNVLLLEKGAKIAALASCKAHTPVSKHSNNGCKQLAK